MGMLDQTARQVAKDDGAGFFAWLLPFCQPTPPFLLFDRRSSPFKRMYQAAMEGANDMNRLPRLVGCLALALVLPLDRALADINFPPRPLDGYDEFSQIMEGFAYPILTDRELLTAFEDFVETYPRSRFAPEARQSIAVLRKMIKEAEEHALKGPRPGKGMTKKEWIAELIFQLRYQKNIDLLTFRFLWNQPVRVKTAAHLLADMGYDALPQLIDALKDESFTRITRKILSTRWNGPDSYEVARVSDCALAILHRISGKVFGNTLKATPATRKKVEAWWKKAQQNGEKRTLAEGTAAGDTDSWGQAERLVAKYPEVALDAIARGVSRAREEWIRSGLISATVSINDPRVIDLLRKELKGPFFRSRLAAAGGLLDRGHDEGVTAMIAEWRAFADDKADDDGLWERKNLISFLVQCGKREALEALTFRVRSRVPFVRWFLIEYLALCTGYDNRPVSPSILARRQQILVELLDDTEVVKRVSCHGLHEPRVCDCAAHALVALWDRPALFTLSATKEVRDRQIKAVKQHWARMHFVRHDGTIPAWTVPRHLGRTHPAVISRMRC
jgi:hypothetical protein